jgi:hypothetical protein
MLSCPPIGNNPVSVGFEKFDVDEGKGNYGTGTPRYGHRATMVYPIIRQAG